MTSNTKSSARPTAIDFTALPLADAARLLQDLGIALLAALFDDKPRPAINQYVRGKEWNILEYPPLGSPPRQTGRSYATLFAQARKSGPTDTWRDALHGQIAIHMGMQQRSIPSDWWPLVGKRAWLDLEFQFRAGSEARAYLRVHTLFKEGQIPCPTFSANTFWMLIAMTGPIPPRWWQWRRRASSDWLRQEARKQIVQPEWAGLWDQWLFVEAMRRWPRGVGELPSSLQQALYSLPLLAELPPSLSESSRNSDENSPVELAAPSWRTGFPDWLLAYYRSLYPIDSN